MHAPVDILELMLITYMHEYWVNTERKKEKKKNKYRVQIPQQNKFFQVMMIGEKEVAEYRERFEHLTGYKLLIMKLRNDFTLCWDIVRGKPSCIINWCVLCNLTWNNDCYICNRHIMCALSIVHHPDFLICVWQFFFIYTNKIGWHTPMNKHYIHVQHLHPGWKETATHLTFLLWALHTFCDSVCT